MWLCPSQGSVGPSPRPGSVERRGGCGGLGGRCGYNAIISVLTWGRAPTQLAGATRRPRQAMYQEDANRRGLDVPVDGRGGNCAQYFPAFHHSGTSSISWGHIRNQHVLLVSFLILFLSMKGSCITSLKMVKQYSLPEIDTNNCRVVQLASRCLPKLLSLLKKSGGGGYRPVAER